MSSSRALRRGLGLLLGAAALLSVSCVQSAPAAGPSPALVPRGALAAVVVESPLELFASADGFWKAAGLDKASGSDLKSFLEKNLQTSDESLAALDFARPWVIAVLPLPAAEGGEGVRTCFYVPYRSSPDSLLEKFSGSSLAPVAQAEGYLVLSDSRSELQFPPAQGADLSRLARYPSSALKLWADPAAVRGAMRAGFEPVAEAARRFVTDPAKPGADPAQAARSLEALGLSLLSQLRLADASVEIGPSGLALRFGAASVHGSALAGLLASSSSAPSALEWASQVDSDALLGASWSGDALARAESYGRIAPRLLSALGLPSDFAASAAALQAKWAKVQGPRGVLSFDLDVDPSTATEVGNSGGGAAPSEAAARLAKAFRFRYELMSETKDPAALRRLLRSLPSDPDSLAFSEAYGKTVGITYSLSSRDLSEAGFSYGELGIDISVVPGGAIDRAGTSGGSSASTSAFLDAIGSQLTTRWTISRGRFVATNGDLAALESLAARSSAKRSLAEDPAFAAFAKTIPPKSVFVCAFSARRLMSIAESAARAAAGTDRGSASRALPFDPEELGSWYSYCSIDSRAEAPALEAGFFIPASDLKAILGAATRGLQKNVTDGGV